MPTPAYLLLIILGAIALVKAVDWFIGSSSKIAHHIGISDYTIAFFLVAVATSLPEVVVGVTSAVQGNPILSFANAIGSNIALLTIVVSIPVLLGTTLSTRSILHSRDIYFTLIFAMLPIILLLDGVISKLDGVVLITAYIAYFFIVMRKSVGIEHLLEHFESINVWKQGSIFLGSLVVLLAASEVIVKSSIGISSGLGLSIGFVGLTITALGTSLPEIAFAIRATKGRHEHKVLGNVVGSVTANSTVVLGITALITPISVPQIPQTTIPVMFMIIALLLFLNFARSREKISKGEAFLLLLVYFVFLFTQFYVSNT